MLLTFRSVTTNPVKYVVTNPVESLLQVRLVILLHIWLIFTQIWLILQILLFIPKQGDTTVSEVSYGIYESYEYRNERNKTLQ